MAGFAEMSAIEGSFREHRREILAYCLRRLEPAQAEDAASEVFAVAWRRRDDAPTGREQLYWLYGVAANVVANRRRSATRLHRLRGRMASEPSTPIHSPEYLVVRRDDERVLLEALDSLRPADREVIALVNWEEVPRGDIAVMLGISRKAVDQRYRRALQRLAHRLGTDLDLSNASEGGER